MKILITEPRIYQDVSLHGHDVFSENILEKDIRAMRSDAQAVFIGLDTSISRQAIDHFPALKYIVTPTTGTDHIDTEYCLKTGIEVISLKGETAFLETITSTAEHTFGLLLAVARKIPAAFDSVKRHEWDRERFVGNELAAKTMGILGYGRLGRIMARLSKGFGMKTIAHSVSEQARRNMRQDGVVSIQRDALFRNADVVTVHVDLNKDNENLVTRRDFKLMKPSAFLINTARGKIVNESDLLWALESGKIKGAAVDVLATEQDADHPRSNLLVEYAMRHDNIVITPHVGGSTEEALENAINFTVDKFLQRLN